MREGIKRFIDIIVSGAGLIVSTPLLVLVAALIKLDSPGPVFFMQPRAGRNEQPFSIFKFRTMRHRAPDTIDQQQEQVVSAGHDPRITRVGRFIRATSLDELPQLINILKGDMSVVGPRPVLMEQTEVVPPGYKIRFSVRPGLTGLAQVKGRRSLGWLQQLAYDAEYVQKRGLALDLKILLMTVRVVVLGSGIYGEPGLNWRTYRDRLNGEPPRDSDVEEAMR
ncbi:sugar transferase [Halomonas sp. 1513]|nr:sugar transferase [Halomonas sp. 1513]APX92743.1 sugar transferase [Halomonas sp. 1513]